MCYNSKIDCRLPTADCRLPTADCRLPTADCRAKGDFVGLIRNGCIAVFLAIAVVALSGCHKDTVDFDDFAVRQNPTATTPDNDDDNGDDGDDGNGMMPDDGDMMMPDPPTNPVVGIFTANNAMAMEGGQIALTLSVTSGTVPTGGLTVSLNIGVAMDGEFTTTPASVCTNLVCVITILEGATAAELILIPTDDSATENAEDWTATLVAGENYAADETMDNVAFQITDPPTVIPPEMMTPEVGIATSDSAAEGGAIVLTVTSDSAAPTGGLAVVVNISGADAAEFTSDDCTGLVCTVTIPEGMTTAELTLMPTSDSDVEGGSEDWTATLADGGTAYNLDAANTADTFSITNMLPAVADTTTLADLNNYDTATALAANEIRAGIEEATVGDITGFRYDDADGNRRVLVEKLDFAHLGLWVNGDFADNDFDYATLDENVVMLATDFSPLGTAEYLAEGDFAYKGARLYPDVTFSMDFAAATFSGTFTISGSTPANNFGDANAMVPNGSGGMRPVANGDTIIGSFTNGMITADGFNADILTINPGGFFDDIPIMTYTDALNGRFHHGSDYVMGTTKPNELSGLFSVTDSNGMEFKGGFLGQCITGC